MSFSELMKRGIIRADDDGAGGGGGDGGAGDDSKGGAGAASFTDEMIDALADRIMERVEARRGGDDGGGGGIGEDDDGDDAGAKTKAKAGSGGTILDDFKAEVQEEILGGLAPVLANVGAIGIRTNFPTIPAELHKSIEEALGKVPGAQLAQMLKTGAHTVLAKTIIADALLAGKLPGFTPPTSDGGQGAGAGPTISEDMQREVTAYEEITGKKVTTEQLQQWGYIK